MVPSDHVRGKWWLGLILDVRQGAKADPLSVVAGVVGLVQAGIALSSSLHGLVESYGSAFGEIDVLASDLNAFSIVLDELGKKLDVPNSKCTASPQLVNSIEEIVKRCKSLFKDIRNMITVTHGASAEFRTKVKWVFRETRVKGVRATLDSLKATLGLMLQVLRGNESELQRAILENLLKEHANTLKILKAIVKETEAQRIRKAAFRPGGSHPRMRRHLKKIMPNSKPSSEEVSQAEDDVSESQAIMQSTVTLLEEAVPRPPRQKPDVDGDIDFGPLPLDMTSSTPKAARPVSDRSIEDMQYYVPPADRHPTSSGAIGVYAPVLNRGDIDLLLSKWILQSDIGPPRGPFLTDPSPFALKSGVEPQPASTGSPNGLLASDASEALDDLFKVRCDLLNLREEVQRSISEHDIASDAGLARVSEDVHRRLAAMATDFDKTTMSAATDAERMIPNIEQKLMKCEADQERERSIEQELMRCREEYMDSNLEQSAPSQESLQRRIETLERLLEPAHRVQNVVPFIEIRNQLLQSLRAFQKSHDANLESLRRNYEKDAKAVEAEVSIHSQKCQLQKKNLQHTLSKLNLEIKNVDEKMKSCSGEPMIPSGIVEMDAGDFLMPERTTGPSFGVPEWLNAETREINETAWDDEDIDDEYSDKINADDLTSYSNYRQPSVAEMEAHDPGNRVQSDATPVSSAELPSVLSGMAESSSQHSPWSPDTSNSSTTIARTSFPVSNENNDPPQTSDDCSVAAMCHRPAWKPPLPYLTRANTLSSILNLADYRMLYFKASQDAYHFYLLPSERPFYIIDLIPSDLTTHKTSSVEWTVLPKTWVSKQAHKAGNLISEEDNFGQMWIKQDLNPDQIVQIFESACEVLDRRLHVSSRKVLARRAEEKGDKANSTAGFMSKLRGVKEIKVLEQLHGAFFDV